MPIHIENMTSDITVVDGEVPLSPQQVAALTARVVAQVMQDQRDAQRRRDSMVVRRSVVPTRETRG